MFWYQLLYICPCRLVFNKQSLSTDWLLLYTWAEVCIRRGDRVRLSLMCASFQSQYLVKVSHVKVDPFKAVFSLAVNFTALDRKHP